MMRLLQYNGWCEVWRYCFIFTIFYYYLLIVNPSPLDSSSSPTAQCINVSHKSFCIRKISRGVFLRLPHQKKESIVMSILCALPLLSLHPISLQFSLLSPTLQYRTHHQTQTYNQCLSIMESKFTSLLFTSPRLPPAQFHSSLFLLSPSLKLITYLQTDPLNPKSCSGNRIVYYFPLIHCVFTLSRPFLPLVVFFHHLNA